MTSVLSFTCLPPPEHPTECACFILCASIHFAMSRRVVLGWQLLILTHSPSSSVRDDWQAMAVLSIPIPSTVHSPTHASMSWFSEVAPSSPSVISNLHSTFDCSLRALCFHLQFRSCVMLLRLHTFIVMLCFYFLPPLCSFSLPARIVTLTDACFLFPYPASSQPDFPSLSPLFSTFFSCFFLSSCSSVRYSALDCSSRKQARALTPRCFSVLHSHLVGMGMLSYTYALRSEGGVFSKHLPLYYISRMFLAIPPRRRGCAGI
jgi:hypothetical protein